jgi:GNAT domain-containint protein/N-acyltransferase family protein
MIDAQTVAEQLGLGQEALVRMAQLGAAGPPSQPLELPPIDQAAALLAQLHVPPEDSATIVEHMPSAEANPAEWWLLERCYNELVSDIGGFEEMPPWPALPAERGPLARVLYVYVFLAATPIIRRWHAARGIADEISWATLADLGTWVRRYRKTHGQTGFDQQFWLTYHYRGGIYRLGRLQFGKWRISFDPAVAGLDGAFHRGDPALGVHIPGGGGLTPEACDASFARARPFYERHFPSEQYRIAECSSWLLDEQLAEYLPADSNIVRFQRRFKIVDGNSWPADDEIVEFVFGRPRPASLDSLPQQTTLERAIVHHLRAGRHWYGHLGWTYL